MTVSNYVSLCIQYIMLSFVQLLYFCWMQNQMKKFKSNSNLWFWLMQPHLYFDTFIIRTQNWYGIIVDLFNSLMFLRTYFLAWHEKWNIKNYVSRNGWSGCANLSRNRIFIENTMMIIIIITIMIIMIIISEINIYCAVPINILNCALHHWRVLPQF